MSEAEKEIVKTVKEARSKLSDNMKPANKAIVVMQKVFKTKESGHCVGNIQHQPDFFYPPANELSYERFIVGFE